MVYFDDVTGTNDARDAGCIAHVRPYAEPAAELRADTVARYNFITPDLCHDMHDPCGPSNDGIKQGDDWLASAVPPILASPAYQRAGVPFIVWDEGADGDGPIGLIALSPRAKGGGYANTIRYTHSAAGDAAADLRRGAAPGRRRQRDRFARPLRRARLVAVTRDDRASSQARCDSHGAPGPASDFISTSSSRAIVTRSRRSGRHTPRSARSCGEGEWIGSTLSCWRSSKGWPNSSRSAAWAIR